MMLDLSKVWPEWTAEEKLGEGAYGSVYKCVRRERGITSYCAIKVITVPHDSSELDSLKLEGYTDETSKEYFNDIVDNFANEISVMENLKGFPNIVSVEDFKIIEHADNVGWDIYIRMELLTSFKQYLENNSMTQKETLKLGKDICTALEICEKNGIIHRDIKADNIFIDKSGNFKLGDFGVARQLERTRSTMSRKGTYAYMAPEVAINGKYDKRADIYSLGMVMYKLLNKNRDPFLDTEKQMIRYQERVDAVNRRLNGEDLPKPVNADDAVAEIILKACKFNKEERFSSATEMKSAIENILAPKKEPETSAEVQAIVRKETAEEVKAEDIKAEKSETKIITAPSKSSKINKKAVGIIAAAVAVIVIGAALVVKFVPEKQPDKVVTTTSAVQEIKAQASKELVEKAVKAYKEELVLSGDFFSAFVIDINKDGIPEVICQPEGIDEQYAMTYTEKGGLSRIFLTGHSSILPEVFISEDNCIYMRDDGHNQGTAFYHYASVYEIDETGFVSIGEVEGDEPIEEFDWEDEKAFNEMDIKYEGFFEEKLAKLTGEKEFIVYSDVANEENPVKYMNSAFQIYTGNTVAESEAEEALIATEEDFLLLEELLTEVANIGIVTEEFLYHYHSDDPDAYQQLLKAILSCPHIASIYEYFFPNDIEIIWASNGNFANSPQNLMDPLNEFASSYAYGVVPADNVDWIINNIFNATPSRRSGTVYDSDSGVVYYNNSKYYFEMGDGACTENVIEITKIEERENREYYVLYTVTNEGSPIMSGRADCFLKKINGKRQWTFVLINHENI